MADTGGLGELLDVLRWRWKLMLLIVLATFVGSIVYAESLPDRYEGVAVATFSPRRGVAADVVRVLLPKYVAYVTGPTTVAELSDELDISEKVLEDALDATVATDTGNLTIAVRLRDPEEAAEAANAFAEAAVDFSNDPTSPDPLLSGEVVSPAVAPSDPSFPPKRLLEAAGLLVGLIVALAVGFLLERGRPRIRTWKDVARISGFPVVGRIPRSRVLRTRPSEAFTDPLVGAAFRTLRTNLEREWQDRTVAVIIVTSPSKSEGKTTVSALFAESLARLGAKTLLVDGDLRRPGLTRNFKLSTSVPGLSDVLREKVGIEEGLQPGWVDGLTLLATQEDQDAGDLLARKFADVMREIRERFDVVVVDTPPLLGTDDARTLATFANGVLLVVAAGRAAAPVHEAVLALEALRAPVLGVVGNRLRESKESYYY